MIGWSPTGGTCQAMRRSPSELLSSTSCACAKPTLAGGRRIASGKYISERCHAYMAAMSAAYPRTANRRTHFSVVIEQCRAEWTHVAGPAAKAGPGLAYFRKPENFFWKRERRPP